MKLAVGIVLYANSPDELGRLARSLEASRTVGRTEFALQLTDNSPEPLALPGVLASVPRRHFAENRGFGRAHNALMAEAFAAGAEAYVCVNADAVLEPDCLATLAAAAEAPRAGLVEARILPDEHPKPYDPHTGETPWCSGTVLLITRALYERVGGFDERFFMYCEDVDLSWRARAAGFTTRLAANALAYHYVEERARSDVRERRVHTSGAYLARKYGNAAFERARLADLRAHGGVPDDVPVPERVLTAPPHAFEHALRFAPSRW